jgi:sulfate adenylyltransferase
MSTDLIPPHAGLSRPINRQVPVDEITDFMARVAPWKRVPVSDADLASLGRMGDGGLSPLTGPMDRATYYLVLSDEVLIHNGQPYAWTIPISFPVDEALAGSLKAGETVALVNRRDELIECMKDK